MASWIWEFKKKSWKCALTIAIKGKRWTANMKSVQNIWFLKSSDLKLLLGSGRVSKESNAWGWKYRDYICQSPVRPDESNHFVWQGSKLFLIRWLRNSSLPLALRALASTLFRGDLVERNFMQLISFSWATWIFHFLSLFLWYQKDCILLFFCPLWITNCKWVLFFVLVWGVGYIWKMYFVL